MHNRSFWVSRTSRLGLFTTVFCVVMMALEAGAAPPTPSAGLDRRPLLLRAMTDELDRTMTKLKMPDFEPPYFVAYEIKEDRSSHIQARYGAIFQSSNELIRRLRIETRVGSYEFDNVGSKTSDFDFSGSMDYSAPKLAPLDDDPFAVRNALWLLTDETYKSALKGYLKRKGKKVTEIDENKGVNSFSKENRGHIYRTTTDLFL